VINSIAVKVEEDKTPAQNQHCLAITSPLLMPGTTRLRCGAASIIPASIASVYAGKCYQ
jgi:hypothetical protein